MNGPSICCILVTYGERRELLKEVVARLLEMTPAIEHIVIVFNGVAYDIGQFVTQLDDRDILISTTLPENLGSAQGFASGLLTANEKTACDYFWLLDDDNKPEPDALEKLVCAACLMDFTPDALFLSLRKDRWEYLQAAHTGHHRGFRPNAFHNFHLGDAIRKRICSTPAMTRLPKSLPSAPLVAVGYAPYGGLFMHRHWVADAGLPNPAYFVYGDDHEYTSRIVAHGGRIYLCASSAIQDIEVSWFQDSKLDCHYLLSPDSPALRVYLALRNRIASERDGHVDSNIMYWINALTFFLKAMLMSWRCWLTRPSQTARRLGLLAMAVRDGTRVPLPAMSETLKSRIHGYDQQ